MANELRSTQSAAAPVGSGGKRWAVYYTADPARVTEAPEDLGRYATERLANRVAARALGQHTLRGLIQSATETGTQYYAPCDSDDGPYTEVCRM